MALQHDEYGIEFSNDGKILVECPSNFQGEYHVPKGVEAIGRNLFGGAFENRRSLTAIELPEGLTAIANDAFKDCSSLESVVLPDSLRKIGNRAFGNCKSLKSIVIPNGVSAIGHGAFEGCTSLTVVATSGSAVVSGEPTADSSAEREIFAYEDFLRDDCSSAFRGCTALTNVQLPSSLTGIGDAAFKGCSSLKSIEIPTSVVRIGGAAFSGCASLASIEIPGSVSEIGGMFKDAVFSGCSSLKRIVISPDNATFDSRDNCNAIIESASGSLIAACCSTVIPASVVRIRNNAFFGCAGLTHIDIPDSVTEIGVNAFVGCTGLSSIDLPTSLTKIDEYAFSGCSGLASIVLPSSLTKIDKYAFCGCSGLTSIVLPSSLTKIDKYAFSGCSGLTHIDIPDSVTEIDYMAFADCTGLTHVGMPSTRIRFGEGAFRGCVSLSSIKLPAHGIYDDTIFCDCPPETLHRIFRDDKTAAVFLKKYDEVSWKWMDDTYRPVPDPPVCEENQRILLLKHWWDLPTKEQQLAFLQRQIPDDIDIHDVEVFDLCDFSREHWVERDVNPNLLGPCYSSDGLRAENLENLWQFGKVYGGEVIFNKGRDEQIPVVMVDDEGCLTPDFFRIRKMGFESKRAYRHPYNTHDCLYHYYVKDGKNQYLNYIESRKQVYFPEYAKLVVNTRGFKHLQELVDAGKTIALVDYDAYNYYSPMCKLRGYFQYMKMHPYSNIDPHTFLEVNSIRDAIEFPHLNCGHGFVLKMLLQGNIRVEDGKVVDPLGLLWSEEEVVEWSKQFLADDEVKHIEEWIRTYRDRKEADVKRKSSNYRFRKR